MHQGKRLSHLSVVEKFSSFRLETIIHFSKHAKLFIAKETAELHRIQRFSLIPKNSTSLPMQML